MQEIQACAPDGFDFARLVWQACEVCRLGLIVKIRVTGPWQRHGYGSRMVRFALQGRDGYRWTTTPQSEDARAFFPALTEATGMAFLGKHIRANACGRGSLGVSGKAAARPVARLSPRAHVSPGRARWLYQVRPGLSRTRSSEAQRGVGVRLRLRGRLVRHTLVRAAGRRLGQRRHLGFVGRQVPAEFGAHPFCDVPAVHLPGRRQPRRRVLVGLAAV